jgi:predicted acyltransferase (DUF342 family)
VYGDAWVGENARVYGDAWVGENARVYGDAWVGENARVSGDARVYGDAWVLEKSHYVYLPYLKHGINITKGHVTVGCQQYTFQEFYGLQVDDFVSEGFTEEDYKLIMPVVTMIMGKMEKL